MAETLTKPSRASSNAWLFCDLIESNNSNNGKVKCRLCKDARYFDYNNVSTNNHSLKGFTDHLEGHHRFTTWNELPSVLKIEADQPASQSSVSSYFAPKRSQKELEELHEMLVQALTTSGIALRTHRTYFVTLLSDTRSSPQTLFKALRSVLSSSAWAMNLRL